MEEIKGDLSQLAKGQPFTTDVETTRQTARAMYSISARGWMRYDKWTASEAACLLAGMLPPSGGLGVNYDTVYWIGSEANPEFGQWRPVFDIVKEFAKHYLELFSRSKLAEGASPREWIEYAESKEIDVPERLLGTSAIDTSAATDAIALAAVVNEELTGKSRTTALKIIGGLAIEAYRMNIHAERLEGISDMVKDLEKAGAGVTEKTLREWIKEAATVIDPPKAKP